MFYFHQHFGLFLGKLSDNKPHKHYALQLSLSLQPSLVLSANGADDFLCDALFLNSNVPHRLTSTAVQLTILINPLSPLGHQLHLKFQNKLHYSEKDILFDQLREVLANHQNQAINFEGLCSEVEEALVQYQCLCASQNHLGDERIFRVLALIDADFEKIFSAEELAAICFLSPTRFLHLFKEQTNLNFRRYQLWNKLIKSLPHLEHQSITATAHAFGFTDSSHYTRTFIETFGVTPKFLLPSK